VITGDVQTQNDADRIAQWTDDLVQAVVTGGACHLDARQVTDALGAIDLDALHVLFIENVGNLVCPASWDLGETAKIVVFSVTEGEDKPLKYPTIFNTADVAVLSKIDLAAAVGFDHEAALHSIESVRPGMRTIALSARTDEGMNEYTALLEEALHASRETAASAP